MKETFKYLHIRLRHPWSKCHSTWGHVFRKTAVHLKEGLLRWITVSLRRGEREVHLNLLMRMWHLQCYRWEMHTKF